MKGKTYEDILGELEESLDRKEKILRNVAVGLGGLIALVVLILILLFL